MHWLRRGLRDRIIRAFIRPEYRHPRSFQTNFFGFQYSGDLNSYIDWNVYFYGAYEKSLLEFAADWLLRRPGAVVFDIGANVGHHALALSRWAGQVHAFEPFHEVSDVLRRRMAENDIVNVTLHPFGLGDCDEVLEYFAPKGRSNQGTGSFLPTYAAGYNEPHGRLTVRNADAVAAELGLPRLDFVKLDVEGFEKRVLSGLSETLQRFRPAIMMELSGETRASLGNATALQKLLPRGYTIRTIRCDDPFFLIFNRHRARLVEFEFDTTPSYLLMHPSV